MCEACYGTCPICHPELYPEPDCPDCYGEGEIYYEYDEGIDDYVQIDLFRYAKLPKEMRAKRICETCEGTGYAKHK